MADIPLEIWLIVGGVLAIALEALTGTMLLLSFGAAALATAFLVKVFSWSSPWLFAAFGAAWLSAALALRAMVARVERPADPDVYERKDA